MESARTFNKIKQLFEKIAEPNYRMNNYYADRFIDKLKDKNDPEIKQLVTMPLVSDLITDAFRNANNHHISVTVFLTRLLGLASRNELHFVKMFAQIGDKVINSFKEINSPNMNPSLRVAYLEVALGLVCHDSGMSWLLKNEVWKNIITLSNQNTTVFVVREVYKFVAKFSWKANDIGDEANINAILNFILEPMGEMNILNVSSMTDDEEEKICKRVDPICHMLIAIFAEEARITKPNIIVNNLIKEYFIATHFFIFFNKIRNEQTILMITKILFWVSLANLFQTKPLEPSVVYTKQDFLQLNVQFFNVIQFILHRRNVKLVLEFCNACNSIWNITWKGQKPVIEGDCKKLEVQNQIVILSMLPVIVYTKIGRCASDVFPAEMNNFFYNLVNSCSEHTTRAAYTFRDLIKETDIHSPVLQSVKMLTCIKSDLNDEQANILFQALFFALKDFIPVGNGYMESEQCYSETQDRITAMTYIMEIVLSLIKNYNINWQETLEILCVYSVVHDILKRPNLPPKFVVVSLTVMSLSVKKFLTPNLSLLLESQPGSALHDIGELINLKMHDLNWEVRDSALELLHVCTELSFVKFPPFQKQIMETNLINVAATIALNDFEAYVQTSALKCLGAATKVLVVWEQLQAEYPDIHEQMLVVLRTNPEGIVRKEACNVLCEIYQNIKLTSGFKNTLYEYMVSSALSDFHWEVQMNALKFWKVVIQTLLSEQGMLDGTFPPVTFSKESRKIVTLNSAEVQKRLLRVLDELSSIGCLTVLVKLLNDDCETEIMGMSLTISLELLKVLNKYKMSECLKPCDGDPSLVEELLCHIKDDDGDMMVEDFDQPSSTQKSDNVIDGIIKSDDMNLLSSIYERHMSLQNHQPEPIRPKIKLLKSASPYLFVTHIKSKDFKAILDQNKKWKEGIRSLSSLLDDMLGIYEVDEVVNSLDCY